MTSSDEYDRIVEGLVDETIRLGNRVRWLSIELGKTLGERDRARDLAVRLEAELSDRGSIQAE